MVSEECRTLMKCGKYVERLDLYVRLGYSYREIEKELSKLLNRLSKVRFAYDGAAAKRLIGLTADEKSYKANRQEILGLLCRILA